MCYKGNESKDLVEKDAAVNIVWENFTVLETWGWARVAREYFKMAQGRKNSRWTMAKTGNSLTCF